VYGPALGILPLVGWAWPRHRSPEDQEVVEVPQ
jgi:hypothetical protein